jgi:hypothetical protein
MEKEFVTYEQALALKELDYDEPCLAKFIVPGDLVLPGHYENTDIVCATITQNDICEAHVLAPTKSQVFRWFREKHEIHGFIIHYSRVMFRWCIDSGDDFEESIKLDTYEEAENACIDKFILLAKQQEDEK